MIKIIHCINGLAVGGAEMMLFKTVTHMPRERIVSLVVSVMSVGAMGGRIQQAGIPVFALGKTPGQPDPRIIWKLYRLLRREKPDIVQTHMYEANLYGLWAAKLASLPVIWGLRCSDMDFSLYKPLSRLSFHLGRLFSGWPDATVVNSEAGRQYHLAHGYDGKRMIVIPNGFDLQRFRPDLEQRKSFRAELGISDDTPLVGQVARFDPMKDYATLVQAAGLVAQGNRSVRFVLVGEGLTMENADLARWIHAAGIEPRIHLIGPRHDIPRIMAGLDMAVSSSISEGFSNVVGEAMACGVPCVVTDVGDSALVVGDTGRVVPAKDPLALSDAISGLLAVEPEERKCLGQAARRRVEENFEIGQVTRRLEQLYASVMAGKRIVPCAA